MVVFKIMLKKLFLVFLVSVLVGPVSSSHAKESKKHIIYETPTLKSLSQLYWALSKFNPVKDSDIDNFLFINECNLYKDYSENEFEWNDIRKSARTFLEGSKKEFPTHFEFVQPLRFAEYDLEKKAFDVWAPYKIEGIRRFEVLAEDIFQEVCDKPYSHHVAGYPKGLYVELNRPFTINTIPVDPAVAEAYIREQIEEGRAQGVRIRNKDDLYKSRDAYLVMKMRVFSYKEDLQNKEYKLSKVLAVLEGYEIYGDRDRQLLMFSENFRRKKERSKMEIEMKKRYQERLKKQMKKKRRDFETTEEAK